MVTSREVKRHFRVREEPVLDGSKLSLTARVRFPPYEVDNEQEVKIIMEESGDAFYPTFEVTRISGDPSRWQAIAKRFLRQLAGAIKEWAK